MALPDGTRVAMRYDAFGRRVRKEVQASGAIRAIDFVWDGEALAAEIDTERGTRSFVHRPGTMTPLLQAEQGEVFLYVNDHLGMPRELVDSAGKVAWAAAHSAWGRIVEAHTDSPGARRRPVSTPFRSEGQVADEETGLCWTRYRCFDPEVARWLSPDPLGTQGGKNLFAFDGSPTTTTDPLGLTPPRHTPIGPDGQPITAPQSTFRRDPETGVVNHYQTFETPVSPDDPRPVVLTKRYDGPGSEPHGDVPAPHIHEPVKPGGPLDNCRSPRPDEIPAGTPHPPS